MTTDPVQALIDAGAAILADYSTVTLAQPYLKLVQQGIGAPGSDRRRPEPAAAPAGAAP